MSRPPSKPVVRTCAAGKHPLNEINTFRYPSGQRSCKICFKSLYGREPSLSAHRPAKKLGRCVCGGDIIKPLKNKVVWICLKCEVGSIRGARIPTYVSAADAREYLEDKITLKELLER